MFSLFFFHSPFTFLSFYTVDYIKSCTLVYSRRIESPLRSAPRSHSGPLTFRPLRPAHIGATSLHPLPPLHLLRTCLAPFVHPYTCQHRRCFCLFRAQPAQCERITVQVHARDKLAHACATLFSYARRLRAMQIHATHAIHASCHANFPVPVAVHPSIIRDSFFLFSPCSFFVSFFPCSYPLLFGLSLAFALNLCV